MTTKGLKKQLMAAIAMVVVAAIALTSSTYAWFINSTIVTAGDVTVSATTSANTLLISQNETVWGTTIPLDPDILDTILPVSSVGKLNEGNLQFWKSETWSNETSGAYTASGFVAAAAADYYKDTFYIKANQNCGLYLNEETEVVDGSSTNAADAYRFALVIGTGENAKVFFYQMSNGALTNRGNTTKSDLAADGVKNAISGAATASAIAVSNLDSNAEVPLFTDTLVAHTDATMLVDYDATKLLYTLTANEAVPVQVYVWMEGCDYDCSIGTINDIVGAAKTVALTLGFSAGATN